MERRTQNNGDREKELAQCTKLELHPSEDVVRKYISFRIRKDFNIEPETHAAHSKFGGVLDQKLDETMTEDDLEESDEFLSAYEGDNGQDSTESSSDSSFTFPVAFNFLREQMHWRDAPYSTFSGLAVTMVLVAPNLLTTIV